MSEANHRMQSSRVAVAQHAAGWEAEHRSSQQQAAAQARVVVYSRGGYAAFSPNVTIEIIDHPVLLELPASAYYVRGMLQWHGRWIPVLDLYSMIMAYPRFERGSVPRFALVVSYTDPKTSEPAFGALALPVMPQTISVTDADTCPLPEQSDLWPYIAVACVSFRGAVIPIIDTDRLFGSYHG